MTDGQRLTDLDRSLSGRLSHCWISRVSISLPGMLLGIDVALEHGSSLSLHSVMSDNTDSLIVDSDVIGIGARCGGQDVTSIRPIYQPRE